MKIFFNLGLSNKKGFVYLQPHKRKCLSTFLRRRYLKIQTDEKNISTIKKKEKKQTWF